MKKHRFLIIAVLLLAGLSPVVYAWWWPGHKLVADGAVILLPGDMPEWFKKGGETISFFSREPDMWTEFRGMSLRKAERSKHYCDLELLQGEELPAGRGAFNALCYKLETTPEKVGSLPYAIDEWTQRLTIAFAEYRKWPEDKRIQTKILYLAGIISHYTADASQPLHVTIHYDGRAPEGGQPPHSGIHAKVDSLPWRAGLKPEDIISAQALIARENIFVYTVGRIKQSNQLVDKVYDLEKDLPAAEGHLKEGVKAGTHTFAAERMRQAALFTATVWYSAWKNSARLKIPGWYPE